MIYLAVLLIYLYDRLKWIYEHLPCVFGTLIPSLFIFAVVFGGLGMISCVDHEAVFKTNPTALYYYLLILRIGVYILLGILATWLLVPSKTACKLIVSVIMANIVIKSKLVQKYLDKFLNEKENDDE